MLLKWTIKAKEITLVFATFCLALSNPLDLSQCIGPLGMETGAIKDTAISASSSFEDSTVGPQNARIRNDRNGGAWCPKTMIEREGQEWLEIDLASVHAISASETQGRFGNGQGVEFTEAYMLEYFRPRLNKWVRYRKRDGSEVLDANSNTYTAVKNNLDPVILASKIRFHPYSNFKRTICLRVEIYGCSWRDGVSAYNMPQGDRRGNAYEFYDYTYDGEWKGNRLINGLGCLTDGDFGPQDYKLSYYAQSRGWVGWKQNPERDHIEILFEFDDIREFFEMHIYTNNQFERDVAVFREARVLFSVGGDIFSQEPVIHEPMEDAIFQEPRNVTVKLHRRVAKFIKLQLFFAAKWLMISEVSFESSVARGNYTVETIMNDINTDEGSMVKKEDGASKPFKDSNDVNNEDSNEVLSSSASSKESGAQSQNDSAFMPIVIGVLVSVIVLLAAIIFFIVSKAKRKKGRLTRGLGVTGNLMTSEKMALNGPTSGDTAYQFNYKEQGFAMATTSSDTGSSGHSSHRNHLLPKLDDNYNTPHHAMLTPRQVRAAQVGGAFFSTQQRFNGQGTPRSARKTNFLPPAPRLQVPPPPEDPPPVPYPHESVYTEPNNYTEPYRAMRYSPYYGYGPVLNEIEDSLMKQSLLSDTSCERDYAVPLPRNHHQEFSNNTRRTSNPSNAFKSSQVSITASSQQKKQKPMSSSGRDVDSVVSSLERTPNSGYNSNNDVGGGEAPHSVLTSCKENLHSSSSTTNSHCSDSLTAMRARLETHIVPELTRGQLSLKQRLSEGEFGTVYLADAHNIPDYGGGDDENDVNGEDEGLNKKLVAVKFLSKNASQQEKEEFVREVRLLSVLEDRNISRVLGMCSTEDPYLVVMEYMEHGDLNQFLRRHLPEGTNPLPPGISTLSLGTLIHLASQVASGMRYLESLNFVHRDLATRNCLVGKGFHLKICDFGSDNPVYARDYFEMESHLLIPIRWMAWESVILCKYTTKSDVWSFGVCLWEILQLASVRPYANLPSDESVLEQLHNFQKTGRMNVALERPPISPKDLYELMCECWKREASSRPSFREIHLFLQRKNLGYSPM